MPYSPDKVIKVINSKGVLCFTELAPTNKITEQTVLKHSRQKKIQELLFLVIEGASQSLLDCNRYYFL